jgi:hypothetical protein
LGEHDALISGSFAIQFFDGVVWHESDLDIFVEQGEGASELRRYLLKNEGYEFISAKDIEEYAMGDLVKVIDSPHTELSWLTWLEIRRKHINAPSGTVSTKRTARFKLSRHKCFRCKQFFEAFIRLL